MSKKVIFRRKRSLCSVDVNLIFRLFVLLFFLSFPFLSFPFIRHNSRKQAAPSLQLISRQIDDPPTKLECLHNKWRRRRRQLKGELGERIFDSE